MLSSSCVRRRISLLKDNRLNQMRYMAMRIDKSNILQVSEQTPKLYFTTREKIHGREITEEFGMVSASAVRSKSVFNDLYVAIAGLFGGEATAYTALLNETTAEAVHRIHHAAQSLGATAVVNVKFDTNTTMNRLVFGLHCTVLCYGTAVKCRPLTSSSTHQNRN